MPSSSTALAKTSAKGAEKRFKKRRSTTSSSFPSPARFPRKKSAGREKGSPRRIDSSASTCHAVLSRRDLTNDTCRDAVGVGIERLSSRDTRVTAFLVWRFRSSPSGTKTSATARRVAAKTTARANASAFFVPPSPPKTPGSNASARARSSTKKPNGWCRRKQSSPPRNRLALGD